MAKIDKNGHFLGGSKKGVFLPNPKMQINRHAFGSKRGPKPPKMTIFDPRAIQIRAFLCINRQKVPFFDQFITAKIP